MRNRGHTPGPGANLGTSPHNLVRGADVLPPTSTPRRSQSFRSADEQIAHYMRTRHKKRGS